MPSLRWKIRDDRGRRVPLGTVWGMRVVSTTIPEGSRQRMEAKIGSELRWKYKVRVIVGGVLAYFALNIVIDTLVPGNVPSWTPGLTLVPCVVVIVWASRHFIRGRYPRIILAHGFCPACGYNLAQLDPHEDGCTVCPECGAAWRIKASG